MKNEENAVPGKINAEPQFAALVAIDWADQEHVWCLQAVGSEQREQGKVKNTPEEIEAWISQLCQRFPTASVAVAMEKCRGRLVLLLSKYAQLHLCILREPPTMDGMRMLCWRCYAGIARTCAVGRRTRSKRARCRTW